MPYSDYSYFDPLHIVWRRGTPEDPYLDRIEYLKVLNHKVVLAEIPDRFTRVKIAGLIEINYDGVPKKNIAPDEFWVNYSTGVIEVHPSQESNNLNISYKGKGFIQYPSSRIYHQDQFNDVVESLDKIIDKAIDSLKDVDHKVSDYKSVRDKILQAIIKADVAATDAKEATEDAIVATDKALDAYATTKLVFKPFVYTYNDIFKNYPSPKAGWTTQVYDSGIRYRFDGISWVPIDLFGGNIPLANDNINGLMSKEDYIKLQTYDDRLKERVITFVIPQYPDIGVQHINARFPFKGEITNIRGICGYPDATTDTEISIQKSSDMINWYNILKRNLVFRRNEHFDDGLKDIQTFTINKDDIFRLEIMQLGRDLQDVTIEIMIKIVQ
ncbi:hypothetical protein ABE137_12745 [Brevibacillus laterosporus]|uniref:hypothetical protein n=1 Tax=Brevibacillus laterosporus TaxID=1465 RepID=UPI0006BDE882|nr:putative excinuclease ABC [Brevibacillus phage Sundance]ALA47857.1 putative excinuclease ABC [Brevibacillus phage Sundance]